MQEYTGLKEPIWAVRYLPGERLLASANTEMVLWRIGEAEPYARLPWQLGQHESARDPLLTCSPDGRWLCGATFRFLHVWDLSKETPVLHKTIENDQLLGLMAVDDKQMRVVERGPAFGMRPMALSGRKAFTFSAITPLPREEAWDAAGRVYISWLRETSTFSTDGRTFAGSTRLPQTPIWDVVAGVQLGVVKTRRSPNALALSGDGQLLALDAGTTVYIHDTHTLERLASWKTKYSYLPGIAWSPDGEMLARTDSSTTLRMYEARTGREVAALTNKRGRNTAVTFAPDGLTCAVGMFSGGVRIWDVG